jgi:cytochrome b561
MNVKSPAAGLRFTLLSRLLHWSMAAMVIAQLFIGVTMVASLSYYPLLLAIHRPLGIAILAFAVVRLINRITHPPQLRRHHPGGRYAPHPSGPQHPGGSPNPGAVQRR